MTLLDGKEIAKTIRGELRHQCDYLIRKGYEPPCLGIVIVGNNPASVTYVTNKSLACKEVGMKVYVREVDIATSQTDLLDVINQFNNDESVDGFIVQLPLPSHIDEKVVTASIACNIDVDGLTPENMGRVLQGLPAIVSATPKGIRELLKRYDISTQGKQVVIIGRSTIVGKPLANFLIQKNELGNAQVTICHSYSQNLSAICRQADIIVSATGHPNLIREDMVKEGCVVIDVGITRIEDPSSSKGYRIVGDVDFEHVAPKCSFITPVPGGVGPMTIASLLQNTMQCYYQNNKRNPI